MGNKLITQAVLVITSLVIIFAFIKPAFGEITALRDELYVYSGTIERAGELNAQLNTLKQDVDAFSQSELLNLEKFLPTSLDGVAIMKDINYIVETRGGTVVSLVTTDASESFDDVYLDDEEVVQNSDLVHQDFELVFKASYEDMKRVLRSLESNDTLFEVVKLSFSATPENPVAEGGVIISDGTLTHTVTLRSYALNASSN